MLFEYAFSLFEYGEASPSTEINKSHMEDGRDG